MSAPPLSPILSRATFDQALAQGPDVLFELVNDLLAKQQAQIQSLLGRVTELERRLGMNSSNSSKPPSSDGLKRTASLRANPSGRKPGGQPGHPGHTLLQSPTPDIVIDLPLAHCPHCQTDLQDTPALDPETRQTFELPEPKIIITEHRATCKVCPQCRQTVRAAFPPNVNAPVQYGPRFQAVLTQLHVGHFLPCLRVSEICSELFGHRPGAAAVITSLRQSSAAMAPTVEAIAEALVHVPVLHSDETGARCANQTQWLHNASTADLTHLHLSPHRGAQGIAAGGILTRFKNILVHDFWGPYRSLECSHSYCNAHLLRELKAMLENGGHTWAGTLSGVLVAMLRATEEARATTPEGTPPSVPEAQCQALRQRYDEAVATALQSHPRQDERPSTGAKRGRIKQSAEHCLLHRLQSEAENILRFLSDLRVPFENNQAERDLRMVKVQQKVSGCFRSQSAGEMFCTVRSYLSTARKQGLGVLNSIIGALTGNPFALPSAPE